MATLTRDMLPRLRRRRAAGEGVKAMATELGVTWQKLDKALRNGLPKGRDRKTTGRKTSAPGAVKAPGTLVERYRPRTLDEIVGQDAAVRALKRFARAPYPAAFLFEGATGVGKTSAAWALAGALGCGIDEKPPELGGVYVIASGEQTADGVREAVGRLWQVPFFGKGWKVLVVNEADRMSRSAETIWLDALESLPPRAVVVFTTNSTRDLSARFLDRTTRVVFEGDPRRLARPVSKLLRSIWIRETGERPEAKTIREVVTEAATDEWLSIRRALRFVEARLNTRDEGRS
jgi:DNA polymerase III delta prime subunit